MTQRSSLFIETVLNLQRTRFETFWYMVDFTSFLFLLNYEQWKLLAVIQQSV